MLLIALKPHDTPSTHGQLRVLRMLLIALKPVSTASMLREKARVLRMLLIALKPTPEANHKLHLVRVLRMLLIALKLLVCLPLCWRWARIAHAINSVETCLDLALVVRTARVLRMLLIALKPLPMTLPLRSSSAYCACY